MRTVDFQFDLPQDLIAQRPTIQRDQSRLLVLHRKTSQVEHLLFSDLPGLLRAGDVLVLNDSRVIPARLHGTNTHTGGHFEILLLKENSVNDWWVMLKPGKRARVGTQIEIRNSPSKIQNFTASVIETNDEGHRRLRFDGVRNILDSLDKIGEVPLPPYIRRNGHEGRVTRNTEACSEGGTRLPGPTEMVDDRKRYQTVFARTPGSIAAPTAGLHFTDGLLEEIRGRGVDVRFVTLHVGLGTFAPVKVETLAVHKMHEERFELTEATARAVNEAKAAGRRVVAVGTTTIRVLETIATQNGGRLVAESGRTRLFIHPPHDFKIVDSLLTNFHLPCSTLLMLVSAFTSPGRTEGRELILSAYREAIREQYRFFSYGDAMLIL